MIARNETARADVSRQTARLAAPITLESLENTDSTLRRHGFSGSLAIQRIARVSLGVILVTLGQAAVRLRRRQLAETQQKIADRRHRAAEERLRVWERQRETRERLEGQRLIHTKQRMALQRWWQEDKLVHNRLSWLLTSQTIMFAGYGITARSLAEPPKPYGDPFPFPYAPDSAQRATALLHHLSDGLPVAGVVLCLIIAIGVWSARFAQRLLSMEHQGSAIKVGVSPQTSWGGMLPSFLIPLIFAGMWGWLTLDLPGLVVVALMYALIFILFKEATLVRAVQKWVGGLEVPLLRERIDSTYVHWRVQMWQSLARRATPAEVNGFLLSHLHSTAPFIDRYRCAAALIQINQLHEASPLSLCLKCGFPDDEDVRRLQAGLRTQ